jgi:hypothetical protein
MYGLVVIRPARVVRNDEKVQELAGRLQRARQVEIVGRSKGVPIRRIHPLEPSPEANRDETDRGAGEAQHRRDR